MRRFGTAIGEQGMHRACSRAFRPEKTPPRHHGGGAAELAARGPSSLQLYIGMEDRRDKKQPVPPQSHVVPGRDEHRSAIPYPEITSATKAGVDQKTLL